MRRTMARLVHLVWVLALAQRGVAGAQGLGFTVTSRDRAVWRDYTQIAVGRPLGAPPAILMCGYYSPAVMPPIAYGEPDAVPGWGCSYNNPNLRTFNHRIYWQRPQELPIDKFWAPTVIKTWNVDPQPLHYFNCNNTMQLPTLRSKLPFTAFWMSNVAIGPYWLQYMQARNIPEQRLWRADLCISVWFNRNGRADEEITLKVTDIDPTLGPYDIKVEPYMKNTYFNRKVVWTFTKCWGNAVLQPRYAKRAKDGTRIAMITGPIFKSCLPWIVRSYRAQAALLRATDLWYNASHKIPREQWSQWPTIQKPNVIPINPDGSLRFA